MDKYLNMELLMGLEQMVKDGDKCLNVQKGLVVNLSVVLILTLSLIQENMKLNLLMELLNDMQ